MTDLRVAVSNGFYVLRAPEKLAKLDPRQDFAKISSVGHGQGALHLFVSENISILSLNHISSSAHSHCVVANFIMLYYYSTSKMKL